MSRGENYMGMSNKELKEAKSEIEHDHARRTGEHTSFRNLNRRKSSMPGEMKGSKSKALKKKM